MRLVISVRTIHKSPDPQDVDPIEKEVLHVEQEDYPTAGMDELFRVIYRVVNYWTTGSS
jgi:hypothetical protein